MKSKGIAAVVHDVKPIVLAEALDLDPLIRRKCDRAGSGPPDFDGNGSVGVPDLLALLADWGPCP